jgi:hypothetical protein
MDKPSNLKTEEASRAALHKRVARIRQQREDMRTLAARLNAKADLTDRYLTLAECALAAHPTHRWSPPSLGEHPFCINSGCYAALGSVFASQKCPGENKAVSQ